MFILKWNTVSHTHKLYILYFIIDFNNYEQITRIQFKKLVSEQFAQIVTLHIGEAYAMQNITKTDRLGLLMSGKANVLQDHQLLHPIGPCEFLDSPEFESRGSSEDKFKVDFDVSC